MTFKSIPILNVALDFGGVEVPVGRMAEKESKIWFEYDPVFLESGIEISPLRLPLSKGVVTANYQPYEGLFGVFNDSLPDGWGRLLLDRSLAVRGIAYQGLSALDRLAYVGRGGMGALVYYPERVADTAEKGYLDLNELADEMKLVLEGEASDLLDHLYALGGSSGGARPKIVVGYHSGENRIIHGEATLPEGYEPWLIKFPSSADRPDIAMMEFAYSQMAKAAGIVMPETDLFEGSKGRMYFGCRRFDREDGKRIHMHTASGLLQADYRIPSLDYEVLMKCALRLNTDMREAEKLYRLAAFNVFAHNQDDHGKNFSFLMDKKGIWRFAPAYDLTFSFGMERQHSTTVMGKGNPSEKDLLLLGEMFGIKQRKSILEEVKEAVRRWDIFAREAGVTKISAELVRKFLLLNT